MDRRTTRPELRRGAIVAVRFFAGILDSEAIVYYRIWRGHGKRKLALKVLHRSGGMDVDADELTFLHQTDAPRNSRATRMLEYLERYQAERPKEPT